MAASVVAVRESKMAAASSILAAAMTGAIAGVPVTASALVFPLVMVIHFFCRWDLTFVYFLMMLIMAIAFVLNVKVRKPGKVGLVVIIVIGIIEFIASIVAFSMYTV